MLLPFVLACTPSPLQDTAHTGDSPTPPCSSAVDLAQLQAAQAWVEAEPNFIDSFSVAHCGQVHIEGTYRGYAAEDLHELQSATKTYSAVLVGMAIDDGLIDGVDQPIVELLPEHAELLQGDKAQITIAHLLTMTSGLAWQDFGAGNSFERIAQAEDSVAFVLAEPLETPPGAVFHYNTGSSHLLAAIVQTVVGQPLGDYAQARLFTPMGITQVIWPQLSDGTFQGGWGMEMSPGDFRKLGQLLLDEGQWEGQALVSADFVDAATQHQVENTYGTGGYGYQMWVEDTAFGVSDIAAARGYGGQDVFVFEALDLVVQFTGDSFHPASMAEDVHTLVTEYVLPAVQE